MELVFNELSVSNFDSIEEAKIIYEQFFRTALLAHAEKCSHDNSFNIITIGSVKLSSIQLTNSYVFSNYIDRLPIQELNNRRIFYRMISVIQNPSSYPEYTYKKKPVFGLGFGHEENIISISFDTSEDWRNNIIIINKAFINNDNLCYERNLPVKNYFLNSREHIYVHKRIFRHHKIKHSWSHSNKDSYTSQLLYRDPMGNDYLRLQNLLNCAIPIDDGSFRLAFLDKERKKYIIFHPECKMEGTVNSNVFHAFHVDLNENKILIGNIKKKIKDIAIYGH